MPNKLWFSLYTNKKYRGHEKPYVDVSAITGIKELEQNDHLLLSELNTYLKKQTLHSHFNTMMVEKPEVWKVQGLRGWGLERYEKQIYFPETMRLLNAIPNVTSISINLIEPHSKVKPHSGDTNAIIRCHLGLKIPPDCGLRVNEETTTWQEGKVLGFIDAFEHEAWNNSGETRIIILFDILKPEYLRKKRWICATVRTAFFIQRLGNFFPGLYKIERGFLKIVALPFILFLLIKIPIRNKAYQIRHKKNLVKSHKTINIGRLKKR
ncbi:MAG: aspartyl/asparaginyl beta-hydroxylase domain-containing protein [Bacteroidetes bacterium]|nr:aspartyl/asparaginyl beta-hydroxylase domain-containing protein [Bacteroidota bacterium]